MKDANKVGEIDAKTAEIMKGMGIDPNSDKAKQLAKALKSESKSRRTSAGEIEAKYGHVVKGSLRFDAVANKQKCTITCTDPSKKGCKNTRDVFTSDLFQVSSCVDCKSAAQKAQKEAQKKLLADFKKAREEGTKVAPPVAEEGEEIAEDAAPAEAGS